jgi:hypothetical protein
MKKLVKLEYTKVTLAAVWVLAVFSAGFASNVTSIVGWTFVAVLAIAPIIVMRRLWSDPPQSMSERIKEALR